MKRMMKEKKKKKMMKGEYMMMMRKKRTKTMKNIFAMKALTTRNFTVSIKLCLIAMYRIRMEGIKR